VRETERPDILLVEDDPRDGEMTLRALERRSLVSEVVWVRDGALALLAIFGRNPSPDGALAMRPRMILLDLKLPKLGGLDVLRALKAHPVARSIPVVVLSSSSEEGAELESYRLGVNSYIVKPTDFGRFCETVSQLGLYWLLLNESPGRRLPGNVDR